VEFAVGLLLPGFFKFLLGLLHGAAGIFELLGLNGGADLSLLACFGGFLGNALAALDFCLALGDLVLRAGGDIPGFIEVAW